jgi:hypothetical protein
LISTDKYKIVINDDGTEKVICEKDMYCPCCQGKLKFYAYRPRTYIDMDGQTVTLYIRRLICVKDGCGKIHHELPNFLCPYKRFCSEIIERVIDGKTITVSCVSSAKHKIINWFSRVRKYFEGSLISIKIQLKECKEDIQFNMQKLMQNTGWLKNLVLKVLAFNFWPKQ